ncbi:fibronectin-binding protein [Carboxydothermus islandicus]|uniref:Fibronectin-binding protein n=1 Tax=Carboxydothermus islandicus TaxID=661089 RepID=A0A1L8D546_9THEO|nr:7-cyano-7-deazaguanine synthase [Carboxydothermus islandicus]GAV26244.1 fibronectin-binding protein [Carboxydothermus islandicus]
MNNRALALFSGGLDSILAIKVAQRAGADVTALHFINPFVSEVKTEYIKEKAKELGVPLILEPLGDDYLEIILKPKYGYGKAMNPCIDCRAFMLKKAKELLPKYNASFLISGEVLGQRPKSQMRHSMQQTAREAGVEDILVRPLTAKNLPPTLPERLGIIDREKLLDFSGRNRKPQMALARELGIQNYPSPAGGCLLTQVEYGKKLKDLITHGQYDLREIKRLNIGRQFRLSHGAKLIVGRNHEENEALKATAKDSDILMRVQNFKGPLAVLTGNEISYVALKTAARITARYADCPGEQKVTVVFYRANNPKNKEAIEVIPMASEEVSNYRIE